MDWESHYWQRLSTKCKGTLVESALGSTRASNQDAFEWLRPAKQQDPYSDSLEALETDSPKPKASQDWKRLESLEGLCLHDPGMSAINRSTSHSSVYHINHNTEGSTPTCIPCSLLSLCTSSILQAVYCTIACDFSTVAWRLAGLPHSTALMFLASLSSCRARIT